MSSIQNEVSFAVLQNLQTYIFDLDGTLADISIRLSWAKKGEGEGMDWAEFFNPNYIQYDKPKWDIIKMTEILSAAGYQIVIFSGRADTTREETLTWLSKYNVRYDALIMRPMATDEFTPDVELKQRWLDILIDECLNGVKAGSHCKLRGVFDDRQGVVDMWRKNGHTCYQVARGNF